MNIVDNTGNALIANVRTIFLEHYRDAEFLRRIEQHAGFKYTGRSPAAVAAAIRDAVLTVRLEIAHHPHSSAIAATQQINEALVITFNDHYLNPNQLNVIADRVETIMHEILHCLGEKHFTNSKWFYFYNRWTVPFKVSEMFIDYLTEPERHIIPAAGQPLARACSQS